MAVTRAERGSFKESFARNWVCSLSITDAGFCLTKSIKLMLALFKRTIHWTKNDDSNKGFLVDVTKSAVSCEFGHIYWKNL